MTVMALWDFSQPTNLHLATKPQPFSFREFLSRQIGREEDFSLEQKAYVDQAKELFNVNSLDEILDYLVSRTSSDLKELFPLITSRVTLSQEEIDGIKKTLDKYTSQIQTSSEINGADECLALYLTGIYSLNFDQSYEYAQKGLFNICGSILPCPNGLITPRHDESGFKDEFDYKDRVLFTIVNYQIVQRFQASAINHTLFITSFISEMGNHLYHSSMVLGIKDNYTNYMRLMLDMRNANSNGRYLYKLSHNNVFYTLNKKSLEQTLKENSKLNEEKIFDRYYGQIIENLMFSKMVLSCCGIENRINMISESIFIMHKDFKYIESLMPKYLGDKELQALKLSYADNCYLFLRQILQHVILSKNSINEIEYITYEIAKQFKTIIEDEYGPENKYAHLIFCMDELSKAAYDPIKVTKLGEHFYWFNTELILKNEKAMRQFEIAAKEGTLSAKIALVSVYCASRVNTASNKAKALKLEIEMIKANAPSMSIGVTFNIDNVLNGTLPLTSLTKEEVIDYVKRKALNTDFSVPDQIHRFRLVKGKELSSQILRNNPELKEPDKIMAQAILQYKQSLPKIFPFCKNAMLGIRAATEASFIFRIASQSGCTHSAYHLLDEPNETPKELQLLPFNFDDLINPKQCGFLLTPKNWNQIGFKPNFLHTMPVASIQPILNRLYKSAEHGMKLFKEYQSYLRVKIESGELPKIEEVGITMNLYMSMMCLTHDIVKVSIQGDKASFKQTLDKLYKFWDEICALDLNASGNPKLVDLFEGSVNKSLTQVVTIFSEARCQSEINNILVSPTLAVRWLDSIITFLPNYDSVLGIVFAQYLQWQHNSISFVCSENNNLSNVITRIWSSWLHSLIYVHSHAYYDVEQKIAKANMNKESIINRTLFLNEHKKMIKQLRLYMSNVLSIEECVEELHYLIKRGSTSAVEVYHAINQGNLSGKEKFFHTTPSLHFFASTLFAQTPTLAFISPYQKDLIAPFMTFVMVMHNLDQKNDTENTQKFLLEQLVSYKDAFGLAFNVYTAYNSENKTSWCGHSLEEAVELARDCSVAHRNVIQLLGQRIEDLTIKFPQAKLKFKLSEMTRMQWIDAYTGSLSYARQ